MTSQLPEPLPAYAWPPLPILDLEVAAEIMAQRLGAAFDDLEEERLRVLASLTLGRKREVDQWIGELEAGIAAFVAGVEGDVDSFLRLHVGPRYQSAVEAATGGPMSWNTAHTQALTSLSTDTYDDFLARALEAGKVTERFAQAVRTASAKELPKLAAGGRTALQAADRLEKRLLDEYGVDHVTYRNGAQVSVRTYARMAARTKSAVAYNTGTLNGCREADVGYVELMDSRDCGLRWHDDPEKANGQVVSLATAARYAISHPNCTRAMGPRPDVATDAEAEEAASMQPDDQRADQQAEADARAAADTPRARTRASTLRRARKEAARSVRRGDAEPQDLPRAGVVPDPLLDEGRLADLSGGSAAPHIVALSDGTYGFTPERRALHDQIIDRTLSGYEPQENPRYSIMGGGPASGKSTMEKLDPTISGGAAIINADGVRLQLPEYALVDPVQAAAFTHEESSYITKRLVAEGFRRRVNLTLDGTGNGTTTDLQKKVDAARVAGYSVNGYYVTVPIDVAVERAQARAARSGRHVPESFIRGTHQRVSSTMPQLLDQFDTMAVYDNTDQITLIARKLAGRPLEILDPDAWEAFLAKGLAPTTPGR